MDDCKNDGLNPNVSNLNQNSDQSPTEFESIDKKDSETNDSISQPNNDLIKKDSSDLDDENDHKIKECTLDENKNNIEGDEISDDENFKDEELDFEEGENSRSNEDSNKVASEDGEVDTEEELEDGEVKEDDEDGEDLDQKQANTSSTNLGNVCRFYSKGLCTWGPNCRFVHQKPPIGFNTKNSQNNNQRQNNANKTNENSLNQNKNINYQNYINKHLSSNNNTVNSNNQYNQNTNLDNQWDRGNKFNKKDNFNKVNYRSDEGDFDIQTSQQQLPQQKNKYNQEDRSSTANYSRNVPYYNNQKTNSQPNQAVPNYRPRNSTAQHTETSSFESEYERKRRLAFESAPWNENEASSPPGIRDSSLERNSQSSKSYKNHLPNYVKKNENAEHYRDPWRRSKSPLQFSRSTSQQMYQKSRSDSGSNFSNSDSEMIEISHKKRLDPHFANKHRPSSFRESSNGELPFSNSYDNQRLELDSPPPTSSSKYYNKSQDLENNIPSSYSASTSTFAKSNEMDVPNYERPKNLPPRSRKDSWSDSDSSCSSSSYSGTGSESDSNSDNEPYSRTNKFESTREVNKLKNDDVFMINEPQNKKQRISDHSRIKHDINKPRSPYSPADSPSKYSSLSRYTSSDRKKQSVMNCDVGSPYVEDNIGSKERSSQKKLKSNRFEQMDRNNGSGKHNESDNGDPKKTELLQQLKAIEEAIARKRSKLK